jgi:hypothetical protein
MPESDPGLMKTEPMALATGVDYATIRLIALEYVSRDNPLLCPSRITRYFFPT